MPTVGEVFAVVKSRADANPAKFADMNAIYQFELTGEGGGTYHATFSGGVVDVGEGGVQTPGCTLTMSANDFLSMVDGKLNPTAAFMSGKLKLKGDMGLAMKLQSIIS